MRAPDGIAPVVIMGQTAERGLDTTRDDRHAGKGLAGSLRVGDGGTVGPQSDLAAGRIGVVVADLLVRRVVVDHAVHVAGADAEEQPGAAELPPGLGAPPIGLAQDRDPEPGRLQHPAEDPHRERRMIDVRIAGDEHHIQGIPAPCFHLGPAGRQVWTLGCHDRQDRQHRGRHVGFRDRGGAEGIHHLWDALQRSRRAGTISKFHSIAYG